MPWAVSGPPSFGTLEAMFWPSSITWVRTWRLAANSSNEADSSRSSRSSIEPDANVCIRSLRNSSRPPETMEPPPTT